MDESHRLKAMPDGYDATLFNSIYNETKLLRKKLAFEIDHRKFGVTNEEIQSWFDVKLIYAFTKYYGDPKLKGYCINSLKTYKQRIILNSYQPQYLLHNTIDVDEVWEDIGPDNSIDQAASDLLDSAKKYLKKHLTHDAYFLLELELNPPPYIINKLRNSEQKKMPKIPTELIADYLDIYDDEGIDYIEALRYEIKEITSKAREYFSFH